MSSVLFLAALVVASAALDGGERHSNSIFVTVEIDDKAAARDYAGFRRIEGKRRHDWDSDSPFSSFDHPRCLNDISVLLDGSEVRLIRVDLCAARTFSSTKAVRQTILMLWDLKVDKPQEMIFWAEATNWTMDCTLELKNGRTAKLVTDGYHFCYENAAGYRWFFTEISAPHQQR